jgi:hypothetical protein
MANNTDLIKEWIQYLKNNQIVHMDSDPKTGKLNYRRSPSIRDITTFLKTNTKFGEREIDSVIKKVMSKYVDKGGSSGNKIPGGKTAGKVVKSGNRTNVPTPKQTPPPSPTTQASPKPHFKMVGGQPQKIREDIVDTPDASLNEKDVEQIFDLLLARQEKAQLAAKKPQEMKQEEKEKSLRKIKLMIRDTLTAQQRKSLWRALND